MWLNRWLKEKMLPVKLRRRHTKNRRKFQGLLLLILLFSYIDNLQNYWHGQTVQKAGHRSAYACFVNGKRILFGHKYVLLFYNSNGCQCLSCIHRRRSQHIKYDPTAIRIYLFYGFIKKIRDIAYFHPFPYKCTTCF